jgi:hypothetical protein
MPVQTGISLGHRNQKGSKVEEEDAEVEPNSDVGLRHILNDPDDVIIALELLRILLILLIELPSRKEGGLLPPLPPLRVNEVFLFLFPAKDEFAEA